MTEKPNVFDSEYSEDSQTTTNAKYQTKQTDANKTSATREVDDISRAVPRKITPEETGTLSSVQGTDVEPPIVGALKYGTNKPVKRVIRGKLFDDPDPEET